MSDGPRRHRLSRSADFDRVYRHGRSTQHRLLVLYRFERPDEVLTADDTRIGITVSRRLGNAVERNKLKRQLREALAEAPLPAGFDVVAIARPGLREAVDKQGFSWLAELVNELTSKLVASPPPGRST